MALTHFLALSKVVIHEGEGFKQAWYNGKLSESDEIIIDKLNLAMKHYPDKELSISIYESDESSHIPFVYTVIIPCD